MKDAREQEWRAKCEQEPLQFSSAIQSFGALLFIQRETFLIGHASDNIHLFFRNSENLQCGKLFTTLGNVNQILLATLAVDNRHNCILNGDAVLHPLALTIVATLDGWIIECEIDHQTDAILPAQITEMSAAFREAGDIYTLQQAFVNTMQLMSGFDRVMIYKFDQEWNGEVVAEAVSQHLGSYLNLHFPASDIPAIARKLYETNPWRYIADATQPAVRLAGLDLTKPLDLTLAELRSVSPMHIQYLLNMQVVSSFSIAIRLFNKLWGLVVCHHPTPTRLPRRTRISCYEVSLKFRQALSQHITRENMCRLDHTHRFIRQFYSALPVIADDDQFTQTLFDYFADHLQLSAIAVVNDQSIRLTGTPIPDDTIRAIDDFFSAENQGLWRTNCSRNQIPDNPIIGVCAAGIAGIKVRFKGVSCRIFFLRAEKPFNIRWAGNPNKPQENVRDGHLHISPRRSFEIWVEEKRGESEPWSASDVALISHLQISLLKYSP